MHASFTHHVPQSFFSPWFVLYNAIFATLADHKFSMFKVDIFSLDIHFSSTQKNWLFKRTDTVDLTSLELIILLIILLSEPFS